MDEKLPYYRGYITVPTIKATVVPTVVPTDSMVPEIAIVAILITTFVLMVRS